MNTHHAAHQPERLAEIEWCNIQGARDRAAWAVVVSPSGDLTEFRGQSLPGLVAVIGEAYRKNGKWSATTYRLAVAQGVRFVSGLDGWESGLLSDGIGAATKRPADSWTDLEVALGATTETIQQWVRRCAPRTARALDERAVALEGLGVIGGARLGTA